MLLQLVRTLLGSSVYAMLAFLGAGRLGWGRGWLYAGVFVTVSVVGSFIIHCAGTGLMEARAKGVRPDTKPFDKKFFLFFLPFNLLYPIVAGADVVRFAVAPLPGWSLSAGILLFVTGSALSTWALVVNRYAESSARIQSERGHAVISDGPYRIIRHPMYAGTILGFPGTALMLGSGLALVPMVCLVILFVWRTAREDSMLHTELPSYGAYAGGTRWRLVPGLW